MISNDSYCTHLVDCLITKEPRVSYLATAKLSQPTALTHYIISSSLTFDSHIWHVVCMQAHSFD